MSATAQPLGDGDISQEKVEQLIALGGELDDLDFKEFLDLSQAKDKVEIVKDFGAFQSYPTGGYILVGVDDSGGPSTAFGHLKPKDFDPANLSKIAYPYLPTIRMHATTHVIYGVTVAVIYVSPPDPPGLAVFVKDGQYPDGRSTKTVFRQGDVFVRRGTQSVRWQPSDVQSVLRRWEEHVREDERRRASAYAQTLLTGERAAAIASGPLGALTWRLASEEFDAAVLEAVRAKDTIALRSLVLEFGADAAGLVGAEHGQELELLLDRLTAALALCVTYEQRALLADFLAVLVDIYLAAVDPSGNPRAAADYRFQRLMWQVAVSVEAVGGLAVRLSELWAVRPLAMPNQKLLSVIREQSWIRHAVTAASRANLLYTSSSGDQDKQVEIGGPVVALARQLVERVTALRPDTQVSAFELNSAPEPQDRVLDSLIQFDVLWCVAAVAHSMKVWNHYPSASAFYGHRAVPAFELLIADPEARDIVLAEDAVNLKPAIKDVVETARSISWNQYHRPWELDSHVISGYFAND